MKALKYAAIGTAATVGIIGTWALLSAMLYYAPVATGCMLLSFAVTAKTCFGTEDDE